MKIKKKVIFSFALIFLIPAIVFVVAMHLFDLRTVSLINSRYDVSGIKANELDDEMRLIAKVSEPFYDAVVRDAVNMHVKYDFATAEYWEEFEKYVEKLDAKIVVYKGKEVGYSNCEADNLTELKSFLDKKNNQMHFDDEIIYYTTEDASYIVRSIWYHDSNAGESAVHIVMDGDRMLPECESLLRLKIAVGLLIAVIMIIVLVRWLKRQLFDPLENLETATENIMEGSFDYSLEGLDNGLLSQAVTNFEKMRVAMKNSSELKMKSDKESRELISNISHDLKTPLTTIKGYVEALMENVVDDPEKRRKYMMTIYNKANDMNKLIDELTIYSKIDTDSIPYVFTDVNVIEYLEGLANELKMDLDNRNIEFNFYNYAKYSEYCIIDTEQLRRVINNIVSNSVKNIVNKYGIINMKVRDAGEFVQVEIEDNGRGISMKDLPLIFNRFYRGDASRNTAQGGSGIGLAIVKKIIEEHGGKVWARSVEGKGTTMYFVLRKSKEE